MEHQSKSPRVRSIHKEQEPAGPLMCPVCGSHWLPVRERLRCILCGLVIDATDEGEPSRKYGWAEDPEDETALFACAMPCALCS
jgi:hypothetical protein